MAAQVTDAGGDTNMEDAPPAGNAADGANGQDSAEDMDDDVDARVDPDVQTTVTDFLDFTEYLPSDMMRSLTLIGKLDHTYADASTRIHELTQQWGQLPSNRTNERPSPVQLRADISEQLNQALNSRVYSHAEAVRMSEGVHRHYNKAKVLLSKLQTMMNAYPTEEELQKTPVASRSPQATRAKLAAKAGAEAGQKTRKAKIPKITVPGEVLAPYDIEYDTFSGGSDDSSDDDDIIPPVNARRTPAPTPRIKLVTSNRPPKSASRSSRPSTHTTAPSADEIAAHTAALLKPPPPDAVIGSADAPWLQLTDYELAKLRKRMKKNATWTPSETMVARELRALGRGPEDYREAKRKAEEEGKPFDAAIPAPVSDGGSGSQQLPTGAISADSVAADELPTSNRGMKLNEAKKLKREALAKLAAEEAEESARKMTAAAKLFLGSGNAPANASDDSKDAAPKTANTRNSSRSNGKRKRESDGQGSVEAAEGVETPSARPQIKRTKTETPVPPPQPGSFRQASVSTMEADSSQTPAAPAAAGVPYTETPVPLPIQLQSSASSRAAKSPTPNAAAAGAQTVTTSVPVKPPAVETPVPLPRSDRRKSTTPVVPPTRELPNRDATKRETRGDAAKRTQNPQTEITETKTQVASNTSEQSTRRSSSRGPMPAKTTPVPEGPSRRPGSRGKALSQEPQPSLATDRPRRASTARNTPAPEVRPVSRRSKRPAPGVVSTTSSGGNSAVGKRKAAPKKKQRTMRKEKGQPAEVEVEEVDDEGNPIDPDEPRYCLCNRVSFGTMIQCDNLDNCKQEWFHLECVGLDNIPARTTKWYCPDCRKLLNIGEKGEVNARGIRK